MAYDFREITHGISYAYKQVVGTDGLPKMDGGTTPAPIPAVPVTGTISATQAVAQSSTTVYADNVVHQVTNGTANTTVAVLQYQMNHAQEELGFHGYTYDTTTPPTQDLFTVTMTPQVQENFMYWFITERSDGSEVLNVYPFVNSTTVTGFGSGTTDADSVTATQFGYTLNALNSPATTQGQVAFWATSDPTIIATAKTGTVPVYTP